MQGKKVVQTEVDMRTYARLKDLARRRSLHLKTVACEALRRFVEQEEKDIESDSLFKIVDSLRVPDKDLIRRKDWRDLHSSSSSNSS